jgi:hypothetical protein
MKPMQRTFGIDIDLSLSFNGLRKNALPSDVNAKK